MKKFTHLVAALLAMVSITANAAEVEKFSYDWTQQQTFSYWADSNASGNVTVSQQDGLTIVNSTKYDGNWQYQLHVADQLGLTAGNDYILKITVKGSTGGYCYFGVGSWAGTVDCGFNFTDEWKEYSVPFTAKEDGGFVLAQLGQFVGTMQIKSVKVCQYEGDFNGGYINFDLGATPGENQWDKKLIYALPEALEANTDYTLTMSVKGSSDLEGGIGLWPIWAASPNKTDWGSSKDVQYLESKDLTTEWTTLKWEFNTQYTLDQFEWVFGKAAGDLCIDNVVLTKNGTDKNLIENGDFSQRTTKGWSKSGGNILSIVEGDTPSGITETKATESTAPADDAYYTLQGVKLAQPQKGINIYNGKKIFVK